MQVTLEVVPGSPSVKLIAASGAERGWIGGDERLEFDVADLPIAIEWDDLTSGPVEEIALGGGPVVDGVPQDATWEITIGQGGIATPAPGQGFVCVKQPSLRVRGGGDAKVGATIESYGRVMTGPEPAIGAWLWFCDGAAINPDADPANPNDGWQHWSIVATKAGRWTQKWASIETANLDNFLIGDSLGFIDVEGDVVVPPRPLTVVTAPVLTGPNTVGGVLSVSAGEVADGVAPIVSEARFLQGAFSTDRTRTTVAGDRGTSITADYRFSDAAGTVITNRAGSIAIPRAVTPPPTGGDIVWQPNDADYREWARSGQMCYKGICGTVEAIPNGIRVGYINGQFQTGYQRNFDLPEMDAAYLEYDVYFEAPFVFRAGKLPGMAGGPGSIKAGNTPPVGVWSGRFMFHSGSGGSTYVYWCEQPGKTGGYRDSGGSTWQIPPGSGNKVKFVPGRTHTIGSWIKMNDPGQKNGVERVWLDGVLVSNKTNFRFRDNPAHKINKLRMSTFFGGATHAYSPTKNEFARFTNFHLRTAAPAGLPQP